MSSVSAEVKAAMAAISTCINAVVDNLGKLVAGSGEALFVFESCDDGVAPISRIFAISSMAVFSPKFQVWSWCSLSSEHAAMQAAPILVFPFVVELELTTCKFSGNGRRFRNLTTNQMAAAMVAISTSWRCARLQYVIPDGESLLPSLVTGLRGEFHDLRRGTKRSSGSAGVQDDYELGPLKRRPKVDAAELGAQRALSRKVFKKSPAGMASEGVAEPQAGPMLAIGDIDGLGLDDFCGDGDVCPDEIVSEVVAFCLDDDVVCVESGPAVALTTAGSSSSSSAPAVLVHPASDSTSPPLPPPAVPDALVGPSASGYFVRHGRSVARITPVFGSSRAIKCYVHSNCTLAIAIKKNARGRSHSCLDPRGASSPAAGHSLRAGTEDRRAHAIFATFKGPGCVRFFTVLYEWRHIHKHASVYMYICIVVYKLYAYMYNCTYV